MILFRYQLLLYVAIFLRVMAAFAALLFVIGIVDELGANQSISRAAYMAVIGQSEALYTIFPLLGLIAAITMFLGMSRSSEIVAIRAAGQSGIRFLVAPCAGAFLVGVIALFLLNPIVTVFATQFRLEKGRAQPSAVLTLGASGLWMRQSDAARQTIIFAGTSDIAQLQLGNVTFVTFDASGSPVTRIFADTAQLVPQAWVLDGARQWDLTAQNPQSSLVNLPLGTRMPTDLQAKDLTSGFGQPNSVPIYALPAHIESLEKAGFSARAFRVWFQSELAKPLAMVVMVLVAAGFTMRHIRSGNRAKMVLFAVLLGFGLFFLRNIAQVLGQNGLVPVSLAAWGPIMAAAMLAVTLLLHLEEG